MKPTPPSFGDTLQNTLRDQHNDLLPAPSWALRHVLRARNPDKTLGLHLTHEKSLIVQKKEIFTLFEAHELGLLEEDRARLTNEVILIAWPEGDAWEAAHRDTTLLALWQNLFHARIDAHFARNPLDPYTLRTCIHALDKRAVGLFDTIRDVLLQERLIDPASPDEDAFYEFVAFCAELSFFHPVACTHTFPMLPPWNELSDLLHLDIEAENILEETRPPEAPESPTALPNNLPQAHDHPLVPTEPKASIGVTEAILEQSVRARERGNDVRALISAVRAFRSAPDSIRERAKKALDTALRSLIARTLRAVYLEAEPKQDAHNTLEAALRPLLHSVGQGILAPHTRLLYDLQKACVAYERPPMRSNVLRRLMHGADEPWSTPLPLQGRVEAFKHIEHAHKRTVNLPLSLHSKTALRAQLQTFLHDLSTVLRKDLFTRLRPTLDDVHLQPTSTPEIIAADKLTHELIDQLLKRGFLHIGALRDTFSRNALKLNDLDHPKTLWSGDALLQLDRALYAKLPGVYRKGEAYMRGFQKFSSVLFGTRAGRAFVLWGALPFGCAYIILSALQHSVLPLVANLTEPTSHLPSGEELARSTQPLFKLVTLPTLAALGLLILALIHSDTCRALSLGALRLCWRGIKGLFVHAPLWFARLPLVQAFWTSPPIRLLRRVLFKPLIPTLVIGSIIAVFGPSLWVLLGVTLPLFLLLSVFANTRAGRLLEERLTESVSASLRALRDHLIPDVVRWILDVFRSMTQAVERILYRVDEKLRFRQGTSRPVAVLKFFARGIWAVFAYIARFCINLLMEPQVNPIKHFPVVTVSHKIMISFSPVLAKALAPVLGTALAASITGAIVFLTPGVFGFLVWEFKENWKLYKANTSRTLKPVMIGDHGETMRGLLLPGFHSGTVPKATQRLRNAERNTTSLGLWKDAHTYQSELHHVEQAVERLIHREFLRLLAHTKAPLFKLRHVQAISSHIRILLEIADPNPDILGPGPYTLSLTFRAHGSRILCSVRRQTWLDHLEEDAAADLIDALRGFCAMCDTDIFLAHIIKILPAGYIPQFTRGYLNVWSKDLKHSARYPLLKVRTHTLAPQKLPTHMDSPLELPTIECTDVFASHTPILSAQWAERWTDPKERAPVHPHSPL